MKTEIAFALAFTLVAAGSATSAADASKSTSDRSTTTIGSAAVDDNMTPYRDLATDALKAFKAHDLVMARKKAKELETSWDKNEKALEKNSPEVWKQIDKAMDDFTSL